MNARLAAFPTPTYEAFTSVTVSAGIGSTMIDGAHAAVDFDLSLDDARKFAAELHKAIKIVEREQR